MEDSLKKVLKASIVNDSVLKLKIGELGYETVAPSFNLTIAYDDMLERTIRLVGNGNFVTTGEKTMPTRAGTTTNIATTAAGDKVVIPDKYLLTWFKATAANPIIADLYDLKYSNSLSQVTIDSGDTSTTNRYVNGDVSVFSDKTGLTLLDFVGCLNVTGQLSVLSELVNLTILSLLNTSVTGDIADITTLTKLTSFSATEISGDMEDLVEGMCSEGRTSGTMFCYIPAGRVRLNGQLVGYSVTHITFNSTGAVLGSSAGASNYATYNKTTGVWTYGS